MIDDATLEEIEEDWRGHEGHDVLHLVAEVRRLRADNKRLRAARTLGERERERVADATIRLESDGDAYPLDMRYMLAIIDRITENQP